MLHQLRGCFCLNLYLPDSYKFIFPLSRSKDDDVWLKTVRETLMTRGSVLVWPSRLTGPSVPRDNRQHLSPAWWGTMSCSVRPAFVMGPRSGELRMQKLKYHLVRTQSLNVLPLKSGVGQYIAIHATLTARNVFLAYFFPSGPFTCIFSRTSPKSFLC